MKEQWEKFEAWEKKANEYLEKRWARLKQVYAENNSLINIAFIYFIILVILYGVLTKYFTEESITAIGQLFADWILLPTVIVGFWLTIREFRQSQITPKLEIFWNADAGVILADDLFILQANDNDDMYYTLRLHIHNIGELVTIWYRIAIDIPVEIFRFNEEICELCWHLGTDDNWGNNVSRQRTQHEFKSNGQHALYPDQSVHIATLRVNIPNGYIRTSKQGKIGYSIVTDKTRVVKKSIPVRIQIEPYIEENENDPTFLL